MKRIYAILVSLSVGAVFMYWPGDLLISLGMFVFTYLALSLFVQR